jgi:uncharacterized protein (DUF1800 family)
MAISRRQYIAGVSTLVASTMVPPLDEPPEARAELSTELHAPPPEVIALHRMGFGPRSGDIDRVRRMGLDAYIDEQLNPETIDDSACDTRLSAARLRIAYVDGNTHRTVDELRPLTCLQAPITALWPLGDWRVSLPWQERMRPAEEVRVATWIRAAYSRRQLQEVLIHFWHNHFHVNAFANARIACTFPLYHREVIRKHCLGNFRRFLEDVARSPAMLYYLNNATNRAGGGEGGNENYARELFELHTLGADHYLKFYDNRRGIGVDRDGNAQGYIDDDVYEAARCFSGWSVADGSWSGSTGSLPNTGEFAYVHGWHDTNAKTVLSPDGFPNFPRNLPAMEDGRRVLDLLARHRGTARHLCTKLCRRFIADQPPAEVVEAATAEWMANIDADDQIARVMRVILRSTAFRSLWGHKVKTPFEATMSYIRGTGANLADDFIDPANPDRGWNWFRRTWSLGDAYHRLFEWPTPTGVPDTADHWTTTDGMMRRWNMPHLLSQWWGGGVVFDLANQTAPGASCREIVDFWISRLCGFEVSATTRSALIDFMAQGNDPSRPPVPTPRAPDWGKPEALPDRLSSMIQLLTMSPEFHLR